MKVPFSLLPAYHLGTRALQPLAGLFLRWRLARGKEDAARYGEKMGLTSRARPDGQLAWLHGASVGEGLAMLPLVAQLSARGINVLVTTGTLTSARVLATRLGPGALHQFVPLDVPVFVNRFLDHWRPDLVLIAESELWPNIFAQVGARGIPLVLVNARVSERSARRWGSVPQSIGPLLCGIDLCLAQSSADAERLARLGVPRVQVTGNLKYDVPALPVDTSELAALTVAIGERPVWLAASTHPGEEVLCGQVHRALQQRFPNLLTLIAPRHVERGVEIAAQLQQLGLGVAMRSRQARIEPGIGVYIADTMGEMGLFYRLAPVVFVGKSLGTGAADARFSLLGGQNPIEPAKLGSAILHGPHVENFAEVYASLDQSEGSAAVGNAQSMERVLTILFSDAATMRKMARAAHDVVSGMSGATERTMQALEPYFMHMAMGMTTRGL